MAEYYISGIIRLHGEYIEMKRKALQLKVNEIYQDLGAIKLGKMLAGGVVSDIYSAVLTRKDGTQENVVVKYTHDQIPRNHNFSQTDIDNSFSKAPAAHDLDIKIQKYLQVNTPKIISHNSESRITLMQNFVDDGYMLLQDLILDQNLPEDSLLEISKTLAQVKYELSQSNDSFKQVELSRTQFDERFYELKALLYNGRMQTFNQIEDEFLADQHKRIVWTDGDQKNIAVNSDGEVMIFDLGRSIACDPEFILPNFLGHIGLFYLAGFVDEDISTFSECVASFEQTLQKYRSGYKVQESRFVNYFTASMLHRGLAMRWIDKRLGDKVGEDSVKNACLHLGDIVFDPDQRILKVADLLDALASVREAAQAGKYQRPELQ